MTPTSRKVSQRRWYERNRRAVIFQVRAAKAGVRVTMAEARRITATAKEVAPPGSRA